uniref:Uncharacterized protein n=1 Tax=Vannella robusta TaxID=1487602 RepID=A0A7S4ILH6_9EUKA|mmetsp:Transcript_4602/g.5645  ORF Transcript_4602/g.5645 Transcript_4602/m.5645 type:complete len:183 (+) Transcript_4602:24-572(+)
MGGGEDLPVDNTPRTDLPSQSGSHSDPWNAPPKKWTGVKKTGIKDPWVHPANRQPQEPYHLKGVGYFDINPTPPWTQPVKRFSVDETLLTHAPGEGFPALPDVQLRQLPSYLWKLKWTHVPDNMVYWYCLRFRAGYSKTGVLGGGNGTSWPFVHYVCLVMFVGTCFGVIERPPSDKPYSEFY